MVSIFRYGRVECLVNPAFGREKEMEFHPPEKIRKVMVIGAGPGGLNLAWVAAKRGHQVHLFEKNSTIGGQLSLGSVPSHKKEIQKLILFLQKQAEKYHVHFHLNTDATMDTVRDLDPDVVVVATGSTPLFPTVPGMRSNMVVSAPDVLSTRHLARKKTVVVGGGATGCEVALYLAESGSPVTLIEALPRIGMQLESMTRKVLLKTMREKNVQIHTGCSLKVIEENGIVMNKDGKESSIEAERVVIAIGCRSDDTFYNAIKGLKYEVYRIGDCLEPRNAKAAIYEGAVIGRSI
jgi:NADPH-dependent 2,4-dienoyl-CoA reductase/sulfur reductase-like enzyme